MSRFQQRVRKRRQHPEVAAGYSEMDSQIRLVEALDLIRARLELSIEELAGRSGRQHKQPLEKRRGR